MKIVVCPLLSQKRSQKLGCYLVENHCFGPVDIEECQNGDYGFIEGELSRIIEVRR